MKRTYETVVILDALISDEKIESAVKDTEEFLSKKAEVKGVDQRGKRRMAYRIKKKTHGFYAIFTYEAEADLIRELDRRLKLDEKVLRFLTVVQEAKLSVAQ